MSNISHNYGKSSIWQFHKKYRNVFAVIFLLETIENFEVQTDISTVTF